MSESWLWLFPSLTLLVALIGLYANFEKWYKRKS